MTKKLSLFRFYYYIFVSNYQQYWNGTKWTKAKYEAKHYLTWAAAKSAQYQLRHNSNFRENKSHIAAIFNP